MQLKLVMAKIIWEFDMELCDGQEEWDNQPVWLVYEKAPLMVRLRSRFDARHVGYFESSISH